MMAMVMRWTPPFGFQMRGLNYLVQICMSACVGSLFVIIQLLLNTHLLKRADQKLALPAANEYFLFVQSLARAAAPLTTGFLFDVGLAYETVENEQLDIMALFNA